MNRMQQRYTDLIQEEPGAVQTVNTGSCPCCGCCGEEVRGRGFSSLGLGVQIFLKAWYMRKREVYRILSPDLWQPIRDSLCQC